MKNQDILNLVNGGLLVASGHSIPVEHYYKWYKYRREVEKHYRIFDKEQAALMRELGIEPGHLDDADKDVKRRFNEANRQLLDEEVAFACPAPIPYEFYRGVYDENRAVDLGYARVDVFANIRVEDIVLETLFKVDNPEKE